MAIPDYQSIMLPLLKYVSDKKEHTFRESIYHLRDYFKLSDNERRDLLPSGKQATFDNRVGWARTYMKKAGLLETPKRGCLKITQRGLEVLASKPQEINVKYLEKFDEFIEFRKLRHEKTEKDEEEISDNGTPLEVLEKAYQTIREDLAGEIIS